MSGSSSQAPTNVRSGRALFRLCLVRDDIRLVAINHTALSLEHLFNAIRHDSTHGPCIAARDLPLEYHGRVIHLFSQRDPHKLDWKLAGAEYIFESTGKMTREAQARVHIDHGGAKKVVISAPSSDCPNVVFGVNHRTYQTDQDVLSNASCTTNCLAPIALVLHRSFGIETGMMTTVHASTSSQKVLDGFSTKDVRQGRSAMGNIIPASTGAAKAVVKVLPELAGRFHGISIRVPVTNVSLVDLTVTLETPVASKDDLISVFRHAATPRLAGIVAVSDEKLVSSDYLSSTESATIDVDASVALDGRTVKIVAWYDNEVGFSSRSE
ncbi:hypothetical protein BD324DRAFT_642450 [Kockovaella imperatae]|uniref:Glyceraldehyde 3-phosphate dehydrogenase NAD(P) binding domain-containing protein n=1 Tax=Kockovaella imperatae TaxID=4999 RepID=A0A1Y1UF95_9TREE|nr:hypothetical protein BD324DRAFT_642450 [Kockovaella imperatae]ORX36207.1 hypothetical protein BD324DRAFT_642450 [Kockovaella imperatae]